MLQQLSLMMEINQLKLLLNHFYIAEQEEGISILHKKTGSHILFKDNGDVEQIAANSMRLNPVKYTFIGDKSSTEEMDNYILTKIQEGDPDVIKQIIEEKKLPHLYEKALKLLEE